MSVTTDLSWPAIHQLMVAEQACAGVLLTLAVFFTGLRMYAKYSRDKRCWGWDDRIIPVALLCYFIFIICRVRKSQRPARSYVLLTTNICFLLQSR